jgi:hypothetical protein
MALTYGAIQFYGDGKKILILTQSFPRWQKSNISSNEAIVLKSCPLLSSSNHYIFSQGI